MLIVGDFSNKNINRSYIVLLSLNFALKLRFYLLFIVTFFLLKINHEAN